MAESKKKVILFIDDDEDDFLLLRDIFQACHDDVVLRWISDSETALSFLTGPDEPKPSLILLDLNMPKLSGREVLKQIRDCEEIRHIPIAILTNSFNRDEAREVYRLGVNSFIRKPSGYKELQEFIKIFYKYWFEFSTLG